jgi:hypothetical protein
MPKRMFVWLGLGVVLSLTLPSSATTPIPQVRRLIVVVCDGLTLPMLTQMGEPVPTLLRRSAIGLLSGTSASLQGRRGVYVTLGSGKRQDANERASLAAWLLRHHKRVRVVGDGLLSAMLGTTVNETPQRSERDAEVLFVSVRPDELPKTLQRWIATMPADACLWLLVPNSPQTGWATRRLTPIVLFGKNIPTGLLTSSHDAPSGACLVGGFCTNAFGSTEHPDPA